MPCSETAIIGYEYPYIAIVIFSISYRKTQDHIIH